MQTEGINVITISIFSIAIGVVSITRNCMLLNSLFLCFQVKLQWDQDDEACAVCGDDEQAEGYANFL